MQQYKAGSKLYLIVAFALFTGAVAHAEPVADLPLTIDDYKALKVVGRGILNKESQATLQLACVGKRLQADSLERECNVLNFLLTEASGAQSLVGKPFYIEAYSDQTIRKQLRNEMRVRGIQTTPSSADVMGYTRSIFRPGNKDMKMFGLIITVFSGLAGPVWALAGPGTLLFADILFLPSAIISSARSENQALNVKSAEALRDRAMDQWQVRPKKVRAKRFNRVLSVLNAEGTGELGLEK